MYRNCLATILQTLLLTFLVACGTGNNSAGGELGATGDDGSTTEPKLTLEFVEYPCSAIPPDTAVEITLMIEVEGVASSAGGWEVVIDLAGSGAFVPDQTTQVEYEVVESGTMTFSVKANEDATEIELIATSQHAAGEADSLILAVDPSAVVGPGFSVVPQETSVVPGGTTEVLVRVMEECDVAMEVPGVAVHISTTFGLLGPLLSPSNEVWVNTRPDGRAYTTFFAPETVGTAHLEASVGWVVFDSEREGVLTERTMIEVTTQAN